MKINFDAPLLTLAGDVIIDENQRPFRLADAAVNALLGTESQETPATEKVKRFNLARAIQEGGEIELDIEDLAIVKMLIGKAFAPLVVGQAFELLEGREPITGRAKDRPADEATFQVS
jgi:hypothetical protein